jgi:hypothetical protein
VACGSTLQHHDKRLNPADTTSKGPPVLHHSLPGRHHAFTGFIHARKCGSGKYGEKTPRKGTWSPWSLHWFVSQLGKVGGKGQTNPLGSISISNFRIRCAKQMRSSHHARFIPMQLLGPLEKGTSHFSSSVACGPSQRVGSNLDGSWKIEGLLWRK